MIIGNQRKIFSLLFSIVLIFSLVLTPLQQAAFAETVGTDENENGAVVEETEENGSGEEEAEEKSDGEEISAQEPELETPEAVEPKGDEESNEPEAEHAEPENGEEPESEETEEPSENGEDIYVSIYIKDEIEFNEELTTATIQWSVYEEEIPSNMTFNIKTEDETREVIVETGLSKNTRTYTFENLEPGDRFVAYVVAVVDGEEVGSDLNFINIPWPEDQLFPVTIAFDFTGNLDDSDTLIIRGIGEENNKFYVEFYDFEHKAVYNLPKGKFQVIIYDYYELSKSDAKEIEVTDENNSFTLAFDLDKMHEEAQPFAYEISDIGENSITITWNEAAKIQKIELTALPIDGKNKENEIKKSFSINDDNKLIFDGLEKDTTYAFDLNILYEYGLRDYDYFSLKTNGNHTHADKVSFADKALEYAIKNQSGLTHRDITVEDMKQLTGIYLYNLGINDISGLEYAENLKELVIYNNNISDLSPLENLSKLEKLNLSNNNITNIDALEKLTGLTSLQLTENKIINVDALENLVNLTYLDISHNAIENITALENLTNLQSLYMNYNNISNIDALKNLTELKNLFFEGNSIQDISKLNTLSTLEDINLKFNEIKDISVVANFKNLNYFDASGNQISDLSPLKDLTNIEYLYLVENKINNIEALANLEKLIALNLNDNEISDISLIKSFTALIELYLDNNKITTLPELASLSNLQDLNLSNNNITNIDGLKDVSNLYTLTLSSNNIADISPLLEIPSLNIVELYDIRVTRDFINVVKQLKEKGVFVFYGNQPTNEFDVDDTLYYVIDESETKGSIYIPAEELNNIIEFGFDLVVQREGVQLTIPASIFSKDEAVEIIVEKAPKADGSVSETFIFTILQGEQTISQFPQKITLTFDADLTNVNNPHNLKVFYYNETTEEWEEIGGKFVDGQVIVETDHFSKFTVFEVAATPPAGGTDPEDDEAVDPESDDDSTETGTDTESGKVDAGKQEASGKTLPNTATNTYNFLLVGAVVFAAGIILFFIRRKKVDVK